MQKWDKHLHRVYESLSNNKLLLPMFMSHIN